MLASMSGGRSWFGLTVIVVLVCACTSSLPSTATPRARAEAATRPPEGPTRTAGPSVAASPSSAYRSLPVPTAQPGLSCAQAVRGHDVPTLIAVFRAARLAGHGAEGCLSKSALQSYSDARCGQSDLARSPGPVVLYHCGGYRVDAIPTDQIQVARADDHDVQLDVRLSGPGKGAAAIYEHLQISFVAGPASGLPGLVITSVSAN